MKGIGLGDADKNVLGFAFGRVCGGKVPAIIYKITQEGLFGQNFALEDQSGKLVGVQSELTIKPPPPVAINWNRPAREDGKLQG